MDPRISVVICTHNRPEYLERALQSLRDQSLPAPEFEVLVVDNGSAPSTAELVHQMCRRMPNMRYLCEPRLGLSWARNTGAEACRSAYVVYLDDDARAHPEWLAAYLKVFETVRPMPACVGGRVWLDWGGPAPAWLPPSYYPFYSQLDLGPRSRTLHGKEYVVGASMAFSKAVLAQLGGFPTDLGRKGGLLLSGEESYLLGRIISRSLPIFYAADAIAWHSVPRERQTRRWFFSRIFWGGVSHRRMIDREPERHSRIYYVREICYDLRIIFVFLMRYLWQMAAGDYETRFQHLTDSVSRLGSLRTHLSYAHRGRVAAKAADVPVLPFS
jgi:glycosyltransferase involved in cell wall biosynthesis